MTTINGTTANDVITGTTENDVINGGAGNNRINGGAGDDAIYGGDGIDTLTGDAGNDSLFGGNGNDGFFGGGGNDTIHGEAGDDTMYGDGGNDILIGGDGADKMFGGTGDDVFYAGAGDTIVGGAGNDTVVLDISAATFSSAMRDDLATLKSWMGSQAAAAGSISALAAQSTGATVALSALGISISVVENVRIMLDGVETPIDSFLNQVPVTDAVVSIATSEDTAILGQVVATDSNGDVLAYAVSGAPAHGTLTLDAATGAYTYTPGANFNGADSFQVIVTDAAGASAVQTVNVGIAAVNDAPVTDAIVALAAEEDKAVSGQVLASDVDGDVLTFSVSGAPAHGTLTLDAATGKYTYTPAANYAGADTFDVTVTDASGAVSIQRVALTISAVADMPTLAVVNPVVIPAGVTLNGKRISETLSGTAGADIIYGSGGNDIIDASGPSVVTAGLEIATALTDLDGSESLSIKIWNMPSGATLSSGTLNSDGSWTLTQAQLAGLTITAKVEEGFSINVAAIATEATGATATTTATIAIVMEADNNVIYGGKGNDTIIGGLGNDKIYGESGNDNIFGNGGDDFINGGTGNDTISGGVGDNVVYGGSGNDTFMADGGNDAIFGDSDFDTLSFINAANGVSVDMAAGTATGFGSDTFAGIEKIIGSSFNDSLSGSKNDDVIVGGAGNDWVRGSSGYDTLTGGAGADTFVWATADVGKKLGYDHVTDFGAGDVLDFRGLVAVGNNQVSDVVRITDSWSGSTVSAKVNGAFVTVAVLDNVHNVTANDLFMQGQLLVA